MSWTKLLLWGTLGLALALLLGGTSLAWAHVQSEATASIDQPAHGESQPLDPRLPFTPPTFIGAHGAPLAFILFALLSLALVQGLRKWPRAASLGLALVLCTFTFGIAVHSVHHLSEPEKAVDCVVFSAAQHVNGALGEPWSVHTQVLAVSSAYLSQFDEPTFATSPRPSQSRAPPSFPA